MLPTLFEHSTNTEKKEMGQKSTDDFERFYLFEFALRMGATISYLLIQSMKYAQPSPHISEAKRVQLITRFLEKSVSPMLLIDSFHQLLSILEERSWKNRTPKEEDERPGTWPESMEGRVKEMENIFRNTFRSMFEEFENIWINIQYEMVPGQKTISE